MFDEFDDDVEGNGSSHAVVQAAGGVWLSPEIEADGRLERGDQALLAAQFVNKTLREQRRFVLDGVGHAVRVSRADDASADRE